MAGPLKKTVIFCGFPNKYKILVLKSVLGNKKILVLQAGEEKGYFHWKVLHVRSNYLLHVNFNEVEKAIIYFEEFLQFSLLKLLHAG